MKISCEQKHLASALRSIDAVSPRRGTLPILGYFLLDAEETGQLNITATDLETTMTAYINATVEEAGKECVPAKIFGDLIQAIDSDVVRIITSDIPDATDATDTDASDTDASDTDNKQSAGLDVRYGRAKSHFITADPGDYPMLPLLEDAQTLKISSNEFRKSLGQTLFSISSNNQQVVLSGAQMVVSEQGYKITGSDGYRIAITEESHTDAGWAPVTLVIPKSTLNEMWQLPYTKDSDVTINISSRFAQFEVECENFSLVATGTLLQGNYPNTDHLLYKDDCTILGAINVEAMKTAVQMCGYFAEHCNDKTLRMKITPSPDDTGKGLILLSSGDEGNAVVRQEVDMDIRQMDTSEFDIKFNYNYILSLLSLMHSRRVEKIFMEMRNPLSPCIFTVDPEFPDYRYMAMPLQTTR